MDANEAMQAEIQRVVRARMVEEWKARERSLVDALRAGVHQVRFAEVHGGYTLYKLPRTRLGRWWLLRKWHGDGEQREADSGPS